MKGVKGKMAQITKERRNAYVEILEILKHMDLVYIDKIPKETLEFFESNKSNDYTFTYNSNLPLAEQGLNDNTLAILAMLNLNYWCDDEEKKEQLRKHYEENDKKYQEILQVSFDPNIIFKQEEKNENQEKSITKDNSMLVSYKESKFRKIISKLKSIFKIK